MTKRLTKESDRLPALSGIAKKARVRLTSKYLAGLWETDLACGLGWTVCTTTTPPGVPVSRRPLNYRAPTWSWASVEGQVEWKDRLQATGIKILRSYCKTGDLDTTGGVHGGYLHLSGFMVSAYYLFKNPWLCDSPYRLSSTSGKLSNTPELTNQTASFISDTRIDVEGPEKINDGTTVYCLALNGISTTNDWDSAFMILRSASSREHGDIPVYSRIGLGWSKPANHSSWVDHFKSAIKKDIIII
jgi:hypothetical protein